MFLNRYLSLGGQLANEGLCLRACKETEISQVPGKGSAHAGTLDPESGKSLAEGESRGLPGPSGVLLGPPWLELPVLGPPLEFIQITEGNISADDIFSSGQLREISGESPVNYKWIVLYDKKRIK